MDFNEEKDIDNIEFLKDMQRKIKCGSPVHKINFKIDDRAIIGMYLLTIKDVCNKIHEYTDMGDINDDTLLVFEYKHVVECCQIIYGVLQSVKIKNCKKVIDRILEEFLTRPFFYSELEEKLDDIFSDYTMFFTADLHAVFNSIINNIWFIPYGILDNLSNEALEEFKKMSSIEEDKNE